MYPKTTPKNIIEMPNTIHIEIMYFDGWCEMELPSYDVVAATTREINHNKLFPLETSFVNFEFRSMLACRFF